MRVGVRACVGACVLHTRERGKERGKRGRFSVDGHPVAKRGRAGVCTDPAQPAAAPLLHWVGSKGVFEKRRQDTTTTRERIWRSSQNASSHQQNHKSAADSFPVRGLLFPLFLLCFCLGGLTACVT